MIKKLKSLHVNSKTLCHMSLCCTACTGDHVTHTEHGRMPLAEGCTFSFAISGDRQGYVSPPYASHTTMLRFARSVLVYQTTGRMMSPIPMLVITTMLCVACSVLVYQTTGRVMYPLPMLLITTMLRFARSVLRYQATGRVMYPIPMLFITTMLCVAHILLCCSR